MQLTAEVVGGAVCSTLRGKRWRRSEFQEQDQELSVNVLSLTALVTSGRRLSVRSGSSGLGIRNWPWV